MKKHLTSSHLAAKTPQKVLRKINIVTLSIWRVK